jgi:hypothetical protein
MGDTLHAPFLPEQDLDGTEFVVVRRPGATGRERRTTTQDIADLVTGGTVTEVSGTAPISVATGTTTPVVSLDALGVTAAELAADAVETAKIKDLNVTAGKLAADAVETAKIKDLNVTTGKLAAGAVTDAKLAAPPVIASCLVARDGTATLTKNITSVVNNSAGVYTITITNTATKYCPQITSMEDANGAEGNFAGIDPSSTSTVFVIHVVQPSTGLKNGAFSFVVLNGD